MSILFIIVIAIGILAILISNMQNSYDDFMFEMIKWREEIFRED